MSFTAELHQVLHKVALSFKNSFFEFSKIVFWLLPFAIAIRLFEALLIIYQEKMETTQLFKLCSLGLFYDCVLLLKCFPIFFLMFLICYKISEKVAIIGFRVLFSFMLLISISLVIFFANATFPLDSVFFSYSIPELFEIFNTSQKFVWWAYFFMVAIPICLFFISKIKIPYRNFLTILLWFCVFGSYFCNKVERDNFETKSQYFITLNKGNYFIKDAFTFFSQRWFSKSELSVSDVKQFQSYFPDLEFIDPEYPFLHKENTPDILSQYFDFKQEPPHIVMIIVEGLGSEFCGVNARYVSPTRFIDSLANNGLYWHNCFSSSYRTVGLLPSILGSLPFGESGFMNSQLNAPEFHSLPLQLKKNGYRNAFFYGGWLGFDNMETFLNINKFSLYLDVNKPVNNNQKARWGLLDHLMIKEAIDTIDFNIKQPRFDMYLTITTHDPFDIYPNSKAHINTYHNIVNSNSTKIKPSNNYTNCLSSFMYADECVKQLINAYKSKPGFENTIFIISGDHNFFNTEEQLLNTQVPLIIWSPMLKSSHHFKSLVSHREVTPSILAMLKNNFNFEAPTQVAWLNSGLRTDKRFSSNLFAPQMNINRNLDFFIYQNYFFENGLQYNINDRGQNATLQNKIEISESNSKLINLYKKLDLYIMRNNKLIDVGSRQFISKTFSDVIKPDIMELTGLFPINFVDFSAEVANINEIEIFLEFDVNIASIYDKSSVNLVSLIKKEGEESKFYMHTVIFDSISAKKDEWTHFCYHSSLNNSVYDFNKNNKIVIFLNNPNEIPEIQIKNLKSKVIIHSYK